MDVTAVASAMVGAQLGRAQLAMAAKMMKMNADNAASIIQVIEAAQQNSVSWPTGSARTSTSRSEAQRR